MLDELKEEAIVNKVGGRFKLSTLIQKRMVALNTGAKPLVDIRGADKLTIVIQEILQDKIYLDASGNVQTRNQTVMANLPGAYPGMPGAVPPSPGRLGDGTMATTEVRPDRLDLRRAGWQLTEPGVYARLVVIRDSAQHHTPIVLPGSDTMADPSPAPALPSTADAVPYVPVSWMAVAAIGVACLFVGVLLALGVSAFLAKKPLIQPELLVLPVLGIVLSFAARRMIRNSEGTRTGENLANNAWWICRDRGSRLRRLPARDRLRHPPRRSSQLDRWVEKVKAADDESINDAFLRTRDPAQRGKISPKDTDQIARPISRRVRRLQAGRSRPRGAAERGECEIVPEGVKEWMYRAGGDRLRVHRDPEVPGGYDSRSWSACAESRPRAESGRAAVVGDVLTRTATSSAISVRLTPYGWMLSALEKSGWRSANQFIGQCPRGTAGPFPTRIRHDQNRLEDVLRDLADPRTDHTGPNGRGGRNGRRRRPTRAITSRLFVPGSVLQGRRRRRADAGTAGAVQGHLGTFGSPAGRRAAAKQPGHAPRS